MAGHRTDRRGGVATCVQIVQQTKQDLRPGLLVPGDRLSTARGVVEATVVSPSTVPKVYRELEREALAEARRGLGALVRRSLGAAPADSPLRAEPEDRASRTHEAGPHRLPAAAPQHRHGTTGPARAA
ncbi:GntR family transcriptional regulator [Streptomyces pimonensis]|uniref:GntR family transcriptional regulator n=1 Tax=Streptomyces pimonensis TaxID=2860288 RepID=A0ABV4J9Z3_9ACTN